jgi:uncharacterized membrane protein
MAGTVEHIEKQTEAVISDLNAAVAWLMTQQEHLFEARQAVSDAYQKINKVIERMRALALQKDAP